MILCTRYPPFHCTLHILGCQAATSTHIISTLLTYMPALDASLAGRFAYMMHNEWDTHRPGMIKVEHALPAFSPIQSRFIFPGKE